MAASSGKGVQVRLYCTNFRCLFRATCRKAIEPTDDERVQLFHSDQDDIHCDNYDTRLSEWALIDHTQEYIDRKYKKYGLHETDMVQCDCKQKDTRGLSDDTRKR